ncbi:hypothetical protein VTN49DRAFT_6165 [Thermomyces lanuginosus]|uniref:uncharacterized protein n=1 Tax=Thermomyces lanuginosus TaxID=5541 RepID=UPI00374484BD
MSDDDRKEPLSREAEYHRLPPRREDNGIDLDALAESIRECSWEELQGMFSLAMEGHEQIDRALQEQVSRLLKLFMTWSQIPTERDEDRSFKRFHTRMQHVQFSEQDIEEKRAHYANVVKAFENALALLK